MAKASRGCFHVLVRVFSPEGAVRTSVANVDRRKAVGEQSTVERAIILVPRLSGEKLVHSLESLRINDSTAKATRCRQRRRPGLAAGARRVDHCAMGVALMFGLWSSMREEVVRHDSMNVRDSR